MELAEILAGIQVASVVMGMVQQFIAAAQPGSTVSVQSIIPNAIASLLQSLGVVTTGGAANTVTELEQALTPITNFALSISSLLNPSTATATTATTAAAKS